jgi:hypothetical protein
MMCLSLGLINTIMLNHAGATPVAEPRKIPNEYFTAMNFLRD